MGAAPAGGAVDETGVVDDVSPAGSEAVGADSPADCNWTLVDPPSAADPLSVPPAEPKIEAKDIAPLDRWLDGAFGLI